MNCNMHWQWILELHFPLWKHLYLRLVGASVKNTLLLERRTEIIVVPVVNQVILGI